MIEIFGLKNCDTCRAARKWLDQEGLTHAFHDVRADGLEAARLERWEQAVGWERLLNRRGTTWRQLADRDRADLDAANALALMMAHPALIKRPVFECGGEVMVGFDDAVRRALAEGRQGG